MWSGSAWRPSATSAERKAIPYSSSTAIDTNVCHRYKPDVRLRFITEELGFESDADAAQFIIDQQGQHLLDDRTEYIAFLTGKAGNIFDLARASAFRTVDIKGQI